MRICQCSSALALARVGIEDGGDLYLVNGNMLPLSMAGAYASQEATGGEDTSPEAMRSSRR